MSKITAYYNYNKLLSYNAVFNFLIGARGLGKTYGAKVKAIKDALRKGDEFIYLRRYRDEQQTRFTFFADVEHEFPNYKFRVKGFEAQAAKAVEPEYDDDGNEIEVKDKWKTIGYFVILSTAQTKKSVAYPNVKTIIFDEFILEKSMTRYLPNEYVTFINFYSTVDRYKDKTRVLFLANSVSIDNPYFIALSIRPDGGDELFCTGDGFVAVHFADSKKFQSEVYKTRFGKFIKDSEYAEYAVGSEFADNHDALINEKNSKALYWFTVETDKGHFSVWYDQYSKHWFVQEPLPKQQKLVTLLPERMDKNKTLLPQNSKIFQRLRSAFRNGRMFFDTPKSRIAFLEIFKN